MSNTKFKALAIGSLALCLGAARLQPQSTPSSWGQWKVDEWGTFTMVVDSDGHQLPGLEAEEEKLPSFVHAMDGVGGDAIVKGYSRGLYGVTIKMETPVMYFYAPTAGRVQVDVGFHNGSISQWYPERTGGEIPPAKPATLGTLLTPNPSNTPTALKQGDIDFAKGYEGSIAWDVQVLAPNQGGPESWTKKGETPTWTAPRLPPSNTVVVNGETEKFLFYRGLGRFSLPLKIQCLDDGTVLSLKNDGAGIGYALVYEFSKDKPVVRWEGPVAQGANVLVSLDEERPAQSESTIFERFKAELQTAGLTEPESQAMLTTWWNSYFHRDGLRVFWILPRAQTDEILPLKITPSPGDIQRVLVGRAEVLTPAFEAHLQSLANAQGKLPSMSKDRFVKAYEARLAQLAAK